MQVRLAGMLNSNLADRQSARFTEQYIPSCKPTAAYRRSAGSVLVPTAPSDSFQLSIADTTLSLQLAGNIITYDPLRLSALQHLRVAAHERTRIKYPQPGVLWSLCLCLQVRRECNGRSRTNITSGMALAALVKCSTKKFAQVMRLSPTTFGALAQMDTERGFGQLERRSSYASCSTPAQLCKFCSVPIPRLELLD